MPVTSSIFTIGHSTLALADFIAILKNYDIRLLVDIRTVPRSRTNPQYNQDSLPDALVAERLKYTHLAGLGGLRSRNKAFPVGESPNSGWENSSFRNYADYALTPSFSQSLDELIAIATVPTAIMCAEAVWWRCHRRIVADYLLVRGITALDLIPPAPPQPHKLTAFARVQPDGTILYPKTDRQEASEE